jgi:hypothetical protein
MIDENVARLRAHGNNIGRYRRLLKTTLSCLEREFIERRLNEEKVAMDSLGPNKISRDSDFAQFQESHLEQLFP